MIGMKNFEAWAPYLENPLTLAAFIAMLGGFVLLGVLKLKGVGNKLVTAIAAVFIIGAMVGLLLAIAMAYKKPNETVKPNPEANNSQSSTIRTETPPTVNIQMAQGSNNVLTNNQGKSK